MTTPQVLLVLLRLSARRWKNRVEHPLRLVLGAKGGVKRQLGVVSYYLVWLSALLFMGVSLANTAVIGPADEASFETDDQGKQLIYYRAFEELQQAEIRLNAAKLAQNREKIDAVWYKFARDILSADASARGIPDQDREKVANDLTEKFKREGTAGFSFIHQGVFAASEDLWPHSTEGRRIFSQAMSITLSLALALLISLALGVTNRELGQVEWSFEWLFSFPVSARILFLGRVLSWLINPALWFLLFPYASILFVAAGFRWWSPLLAVPFTLYFGILAGSISVFLEVVLRKYLGLSQLKNAQAFCTVVGASLLLLYMTLSSRTVASTVVPLVGHLTWPLCWLPSALPLIWARPESGLGEILLATMGMILFSLALPWLATLGCDLLTRDGLLQTATTHQAKRRKSTGFASRLRHWTWAGSEVWAIEWSVLKRDRNLLIQVLVTPLIVIIYYLLSSATLLAAAASYFKHGAALAFAISAYIALNSALPILNREQKTLWMLLSLPRDLGRILRQKTEAWAVFGFIYGLCALSAAASIQATLSWTMLGDAAVSLAGVVIYGYLAGGIGVLATSCLEQETSFRMRPDLIYLYILLATLYANAVYEASLALKAVQIGLTIAMTWALWQRVERLTPYLLDPTETPPKRIDLFDVFVTLLLYYVANQAVLGIELHLFVLPIEAPSSQMWAQLIAGLLACGGSYIVFLINRVPRLPEQLGLQGEAKPSVVPVISLTALALFTSGLYFHFAGVPQLVDGHLAANGSQIPFAPSYLRDNSLLALSPWLFLASPLFHGYLFRGLLLGRLPSGWWGVVLAGLVYAAMVATQPLLFLPTLCLGLASGACFRSTGSLWPAVLLHVIYNLGMIRLYGITAAV